MDTRDKRASALACGLAFLAILPAPDGLALDQGDRQQVAGVYRGIAAGAPVLVVPGSIRLLAGGSTRLSVSGGGAGRINLSGGASDTIRVSGGSGDVG